MSAPQIVQTQLQLVAIQPFRSPAELETLLHD